MIQEAYCSFEVSKLLKEKGFECEKKSISAMYNELGVFHSLSTANDEYYDYEDFDKHDYIAPTQQMAMRWLREVHDIKIMIRPYVDGTYSYEILNGFWYVNFDSYEDAAEEAIKYCLEYLI